VCFKNSFDGDFLYSQKKKEKNMFNNNKKNLKVCFFDFSIRLNIMASLSVKDRLAALKAKLNTASENNNNSNSSGSNNNNSQDTTAISASSQQSQNTTTISPPPATSSSSSQPEDKNNQQQQQGIVPTMIRPPINVNPTRISFTSSLAHAQYVAKITSRADTMEQRESTPEGVRPTARNFAMSIVKRTCGFVEGDDLAGTRRQRQETVTSSQQQVNFFGANATPASVEQMNNKAQRKQDSAFLGVNILPVNRKCEDINEKYILGTPISEGVFGVVYRGTSRKSHEPFALKKIKDNWFTESREGFPHYLLRELDLCLRMKHPTVMEGIEIASNRPTEKEFSLNTTATEKQSSSSGSVKSLFVGELCSAVAPPTPSVRPSIHLVTEFGGRNLRHEIIRLSRPLDVPAVKHIITQILQGMNFMHKNNIIHRDLKPSNVLVATQTATVKVCDFGLARTMKPDNNTKRRQLSSNVVTLFYRAPELHFGLSDYHAAIDVWSIGCIFAELLIGNPLFIAHEEDHHLQEVCRIIGIPTEESFPGFTLLPKAVELLGKVTVNSQDVEQVQREHASKSATFNVSHLTGCGVYVKSSILRRHIRNERNKLFSPDAAGENLQKDPRYALTENCFELLDLMLQWSPKMRITCEEALKHPFLTSEAPQAAAYDIEQRRQVSRQMLQQQQQLQQQQNNNNNSSLIINNEDAAGAPQERKSQEEKNRLEQMLIGGTEE
jgi:serine/threonine protein kinase